MSEVTYLGPKDGLRLRDTDRVLRRGERARVPDTVADRLAGRPDVTVHRPAVSAPEPTADDD